MSAFLLIAPLFIVMAVGFALKKSDILNESFISKLNALLLRVLLPALLFRSTSRGNITDLGIPALAFLISILFVAALAIALSLLMQRTARGAFVQSSFRGNLAYLGLPVITAVAGDEAVPIAAAILAVGLVAHIVMTIVLLQVLNPDTPTKGFRANLMSVVTNPLILAAAGGILFSSFGLELPRIVTEPLDLLARGALPLALLIVGGTVSFNDIGSRVAPTLLAVAFKLLFLPAVAYAVSSWIFQASPETTSIVVIMAASPTAILAQSFAEAFGADGRLAAATVALSTMLGIVTFPLWAVLVG